jgi:hypothetical protein
VMILMKRDFACFPDLYKRRCGKVANIRLVSFITLYVILPAMVWQHMK